MSWILTIVGIIIVFSLIVLIHEFGHYIMCRKFNIKVLEFGFGIPPRLIGKRIGETIYSINWFPIGGFVQPLGEDDIDEKVLQDSRSFAAQNVWKRISVVIAGVVMNLLLAFFVYYIFLSITGFSTQLPLITDYHFLGANQQNKNLVIVADVTSTQNSINSSFVTNTAVTELNHQNIEGIEDFNRKIQENAGKTVTLTLSRPPYSSTWKDIIFTLPKKTFISVDAVVDGSPAQLAGLKSGDKIIAFNNKPLQGIEEFITQTKSEAGKQINLTITDQNGTNQRQITLTPRINPPANQGSLGIAIHQDIIPNVDLSEEPIAYLTYPTFAQKIFSGVSYSYNVAGYSYVVLSKLISTAIADHSAQPASYAVGGPIAIGAVSHQIWMQPDWGTRISQSLNLIGGISLSLAIFNVLPIPALDGGRLFFLLIEAIFKIKVNPKIERQVHTIGMAVLLVLSVLVAFSDINNYILH